MGLVDRLRTLLQGPDEEGSGPEQPFRCLRCGTGLDREHEACPECGGSFVVPASGEDGGGPEAPPWQ